MKIIHINLERGWYGGERQTHYLMQGLRELGHTCVAIARADDIFAQRISKDGFTVSSIRKPFIIHGHLLRDCDVIHAHEVRGLQLAVLWKILHKRPVIYTRRVDYYPGRHFINRLKYREIDRLVAISSTIQSMMLQWGVPPDKIRLIHSAVFMHKEFPSHAPEELKQRFQGKKVIGCIASLVRHKDHNTLLGAADIIRNSRDDVIFLLIGEGELRGELERKVRDMGLNNIVFEGYQDNPYKYFPLFDIFTLSSREEGLGSSILDAFLYRVPVVASAAGGIPDLVKDGETGLLVPIENPLMLAQGLMRMLYDETLRTRCTEKAYVLLQQKFTVEAMSRSYEALYRETLTGKGGT
jgi:L-malate glycosyltransferase